MVYWLKTIRPLTSSIAGISAAITIYWGTNDSLINSILLSFPILLITMAGFIINDIFDKERDKARKEDKPIAHENISVKDARKTSILLIVGSFSIVLISGNQTAVFIVILAIIAIFLYTPIIYRLPIIKGFYTAILCCVPMLFGSTYSQRNIPLNMYLILVFFIMARELIIDLKDYKYDATFGLHTMPYYFGTKVSEIIGWLAMWISIILLITFSTNIFGKILACFALASLAFIQWLMLKNNKKAALYNSRLVLVLGSLAIASTIMK